MIDISFKYLQLHCRESVEQVSFSKQVTFIHGPVGTGKSSVANLVDYCMGGSLTKTPALSLELISAHLYMEISGNDVLLERELANDNSVRVTWEKIKGEANSILVPIEAKPDPVYIDSVYNLSDMIFCLAGVEPLKVRRSKMDPDSPLVRLSFRDVMWYCYLQQETLDSSFFQMEHPFKRNKSIDVMRYLVGLYSDELGELEKKRLELNESIKANKLAIEQIQKFLKRFKLGSNLEIKKLLLKTEEDLKDEEINRDEIESKNIKNTHAVEPLRNSLRRMSTEVASYEESVFDLKERIEKYEELKADLISNKIKSTRVSKARDLLSDVHFKSCPQCGSSVENRKEVVNSCYLCGGKINEELIENATDYEFFRKELNTRIDDLDVLINKHKAELAKEENSLRRLESEKYELDERLSRELRVYDSAYVSQIRFADQKIAKLSEQQRYYERLAEFPNAIDEMNRMIAVQEGEKKNVIKDIEEEYEKLKKAKKHISQIEEAFLSIMLQIEYPGVELGDKVVIDQDNWQPKIYHQVGEKEVVWGFSEASSGGKKVLFNVCYVLAIHQVAVENNFPLPTFLIIDSLTKNISRDVNPKIVSRLFDLIFEMSSGVLEKTQIILIDSNLVLPGDWQIDFKNINLTKEKPLVSYYRGP